MRIAVASRGMDVAARYEFAEDLTCYNVEKGIIVGCQNMPFPRMAVGSLVDTLVSLGIDVFITGSISYDIANRYCAGGIEIVAGASGSARDVVTAYVSKTLSGVEDVCEEEEESCLL